MTDSPAPEPSSRPWPHVLWSRRWAIFLVMGLAFFLFGLGTVNLLFLFQANVALVRAHGMQALADGAARQLLEIAVTGYASLAAYVFFKVCEHRLLAGAKADPVAPG